MENLKQRIQQLREYHISSLQLIDNALADLSLSDEEKHLFAPTLIFLHMKSVNYAFLMRRLAEEFFEVREGFVFPELPEAQ